MSVENGTSTKKQLKIGIIGAGLSGICAAIKLKEKLDLKISLDIFERHNDIGGTWLVNTYPGAACDVPSHYYCYSFEQNPNWTSTFATQPEIIEYLKKITVKYNLYPHMKFNTTVNRVVWDEGISKWRLYYSSNENPMEIKEIMYDVLINAVGVLRQPHIPSEFDKFKGHKWHTAEWNNTVSYENKIVGVIGSGASAIELIPSIASKVKELHVYQRKPAWVVPRDEIIYKNYIKKIFQLFPPILWLFRIYQFLSMEIIFTVILANSIFNRIGCYISKNHMKKQIGNTNVSLLNKLTPNYTFGCKRVTTSDEYFPTFLLPNVYLNRSKIINIDGNIIYTEDGTKQHLDILIFATGFKVHNYFDPMEIIGKNSIKILQDWIEDRPKMYLGIVSNSTPNHFTCLGPNTTVGYSSTVFMIECQVNLIVRIIQEMIKRSGPGGVPIICTLKKSVEDEFMKKLDTNINKTVWVTEACGSWYTNKNGYVTTQWPQTCSTYWWKTKYVNMNNFIFNTK